MGERRETTEAGEELFRFYTRSQCRPVWYEGNALRFEALLLINALVRAQEEGLVNGDRAYHLEAILSLMERLKANPALKSDPAVLAQLDILLSDAYMMFANHLYYGAVRKDSLFDTWTVAPKKTMAWGEYLRDALEGGALQASLDRLPPRHTGYQKLKQMLLRYERIRESGGWPLVYSSEDIEGIKARLMAEGDLDDEAPEGYKEGIIRFQFRHGLKPDGIVGNETMEKMNLSVEAKIAAIRLNMERWRWMPEKLEENYIEVNIPGFYLSIVEGDEELFRMRAIIGREERPTAIFNAKMTYIVVNPYWRIPETILREDIFPKVRRNIGYLAKERIRIFRHGDEKGTKPVSPYAINWKKADPARFPYYLRQDAWKKNPLGRLKFMFPNPYDIYVHDTPDKHLFEKTKRSYSSGCIRINEPVKLAEYLFAREQVDRDIDSLMAAGKNKNIFLRKPIRVYVSYWTVWEDTEGLAHFSDDLYGYDKELASILGWEYSDR